MTRVGWAGNAVVGWQGADTVSWGPRSVFDSGTLDQRVSEYLRDILRGTVYDEQVFNLVSHTDATPNSCDFVVDDGAEADVSGYTEQVFEAPVIVALYNSDLDAAIVDYKELDTAFVAFAKSDLAVSQPTAAGSRLKVVGVEKSGRTRTFEGDTDNIAAVSGTYNVIYTYVTR